LMQMGKTSKALDILQRASKKNGKQWPKTSCLENVLAQEKSTSLSFLTELKDSLCSFSKIFKTRELRKRSLVMGFIWFTVAGVYFGLLFYNVKLKGNLYVIILLNSVMGFPSSIIQVWANDKFGRRMPLALCLLLTSVIAMIMGGVLVIEQNDLVNDYQHVYAIALVCLGTVAISLVSMAFSMLYVYTPELYPTVVRNVGLGFGSTVARIGTILSPFLNQLRDQGLTFVPLFTYGSLLLLAGLASFFLPETCQSKMPETIEDVEDNSTSPAAAIALSSVKDEKKVDA